MEKQLSCLKAGVAAPRGEGRNMSRQALELSGVDTHPPLQRFPSKTHVCACAERGPHHPAQGAALAARAALTAEASCRAGMQHGLTRAHPRPSSGPRVSSASRCSWHCRHCRRRALALPCHRLPSPTPPHPCPLCQD